MREFIQGHKANFIDRNDVLVGFDNEGSCCENFGWFYSEELLQAYSHDAEKAFGAFDLDSFVFDPTFMHDASGGEYENMVSFKLTSGEKVIYLNLFNCHNGYYSHGFDLSVGGEVKRSGSL